MWLHKAKCVCNLWPPCVCIQSFCGNERLHSGPQGPVHQHLHVHTLPAPAPPVQLRRPVWPTGPPAPQPLPTVPPAGAAAGGCWRPGAPGHTYAHRRRVRTCSTQTNICAKGRPGFDRQMIGGLKSLVFVMSQICNHKLAERFFEMKMKFIFTIKITRTSFFTTRLNLVFQSWRHFEFRLLVFHLHLPLSPRRGLKHLLKAEPAADWPCKNPGICVRGRV